MDVFTDDESVAHLLRHVPELDLADAKKVADALGTCPWRSSRPAHGWSRPE